MTSAAQDRSPRLLLIALVLLAPAAARGAPVLAQGMPADIRPIVQLAFPTVDGSTYVPVGSGTIVTSDGLILTNRHVYDVSAENARRMGITTDSMIVLFDDDNDRHTPPVPMFVAERLAHWYSAFPGEPEYDVAAVRIVRDLATGRAVADRRLPYLELGNPFDLPDHAVITVLGFPAAGGENLTVTRGNWANYQQGNPDPNVMDGSLLVTASAWPGNSGGAALHDGRLIGIPTYGDVGTLYVHPITWAAPLFAYLEYRLGADAPDIPTSWVRSPRNRDPWTRTRATLMGRVESSDGGPVADVRVYVHAEDRSLAEVRMLHALDGGRVPFVRVVQGRIVYAAYSTDEAGFFEAWIEREGRFRVGIVGEAYRTMVSDPYRPAESYVQSFGEPFALERRVEASRPSQNVLTFRPSAGICFLAAEDTIRILEEPRLFSPVARVLDPGQRVTFIGPRGSLDDSTWLRVSWTQERELRNGWIAPRLASYSTSCIGPTD